MGTEGGDKCVDNVDKLRKKWWGGEKGTNPEEVCNTTGRQRGQGNFELAANFGYSSRGSADPRESLRKRRISKLALSAHKVLPPPDVADRFRILIFTWGGVVEADSGWKEKHKKKITGYGAGERIRGSFYI